jgi:hypothetical protein
VRRYAALGDAARTRLERLVADVKDSASATTRLWR